MTGWEVFATGAPAGTLGVVGGLAVMVPMEAGVPVPLPSDLVMLAVGARVSAGDLPLWVAVLAFEAIAVLGTVVLFLVIRGPGHALVARLGPRIGLTPTRLARMEALLERRGRLALAMGRGTPGLRTLTVVVAGGSGLDARRALPPLLIGSSIFLQLHLFLGYFLGTSARHALKAATAPAIGVAAAFVIVAVLFWFARRRGRPAARGFLEGACPACLALAVVSGSSRGYDRDGLDRPLRRGRASRAGATSRSV